jgi:ribose transport system ATP-binding protein
VANNIFLGTELMKNNCIDEKECERRSRDLLDNLGIDIDPKIQVQSVSVGYQQMIEIAKAVSKNAKLLIMDEPTAAISGKEVEVLMKLIKKLRQSGIAIIYISHRLEEIFDIANEVTVMRDGKYIGTLEITDCSRQKLISMMVGREMKEAYPKGSCRTDEVVLRVQGLTNEKIKDINFTLYKGEILGIAGLVGAGRTEVARAIFGADNCTGCMELFGREYIAASPEVAVKNGLAFITEDRKQQGLFMNLSVRENISMASMGSIMKWWPHLDMKKDKIIAENYKIQLLIKTPTIEQRVSNLSGGNQQKVVLAKWLLTNSKVIIFDEPTRGIDVGVKFEIYHIMKDLAKKGISIIMISSELPEIIGVSDRILVMKNGRIAGEISKMDATQEKILNYAFN